MPLITNLKSDFRLKVSFPVFEKNVPDTIIGLFNVFLGVLRVSHDDKRHQRPLKPLKKHFRKKFFFSLFSLNAQLF